MTITITRDDVNGHHVTDGDHTIWISNVTSNGWFIACAAHTDVGCEFQDVENAPTETEQMLHVIDALGVKLDWSQARKITRSNTTTIAHESDRVNQMKARRAVHDEYTTKQRRVEQAERALHYERTILTEIKRDLKQRRGLAARFGDLDIKQMRSLHKQRNEQESRVDRAETGLVERTREMKIARRKVADMIDALKLN